MAAPQKIEKLSNLSTRDAFSQARAQATVGRALSGSWFEPPQRQAVRWHIWQDGKKLQSLLCGTSKQTKQLIWLPGPEISFGDLANVSTLLSNARAVLAGGMPQLGKPSGVGVVYHFAETFETSIVKKDYATSDTYEAAVTNIRDIPQEVVGEEIGAALDSSQWRYFPLLERNSGLAIQLPRKRFDAWQACADADSDIKITVHAAPLEMLTVLLRLVRGIAVSEARPVLFVLYYERFTVLAPVDVNRNVLALRALQHVNRELPQNFASEMVATVQKENFENPLVVLVKCGDRGIKTLVTDMEAYHAKNPGQAEYEITGIQEVEMAGLLEQEGLVVNSLTPEAMPRPEMLTEYPDFLLAGVTRSTSIVAQSENERIFGASQENFTYDDSETRAARLTRSGALMLLALRAAKLLGLVLMAGLVLLCAYTVVTTMRSAEWNQDPATLTASRTQLDELNGKKQFLDYWTAKLQPRSQAWAGMDILLALFPPDKETILTTAKYTAAPSNMTTKGKSIPWERHWIVEGLATEKGQARNRSTIQQEDVTRIFNAQAQRLRDPSFAVTATSSVTATVREEQNPRYDQSRTGLGDPTNYRFKFRAEIVQTFAAGDPLALVRSAKAAAKATTDAAPGTAKPTLP